MGARNSVRLVIDRDKVETIDAVGNRVRTAATVGATATKGEPSILFVGESIDSMRKNIEDAHRSGKLPNVPTFVLPGEDNWWDRQWRWPRPTDRERRRGHPPDDSSYFTIAPLRAETWSPPFAIALLRYALFLPTGGGGFWRLFRRPRVTVSLSPDFNSVERAEIVDELRARHVGIRVVLEPPNQVPHPPTLAIDVVAWVLGVAILLGLGGVVFARRHGRPWLQVVLLAVVLGLSFAHGSVSRKRALVARRRDALR